MGSRIWVVGVLLGTLCSPLSASVAIGAVVVQSGDAAQTVVVRDLVVRDGSVSGTVVNRSAATVRSVQMLLRQDWRWNDERHPGEDNPGRALPFRLSGDVAPNGSARFSFDAPPLARRSDGQFVTTMDIVSFSEVMP